ncbi:K+/H+ antiporter subunit F [Pararhodobacter zhoushanensis]|uniref:K+/H+ antiporter subunit F n=1 Tax=Pararhodobacter zhoushanensis TaxID=2479545 RepID=A0ABT3H0V9_9RHOB|nr:K+/H+ antiporter subunit F [Pararhodobacter zhoushanensis]MCW1933432.1 K+/H+ antiporter subunit F [Pararhodobacter zhoushanensis]
MIGYALTIAIGAFSLGLLLNLWRVATGPNISDRILALDTMVINAIALLILLGIALGSSIFFEVSMLFALVGFISTVSYCRFLLRGDIIE